MQTTVFKAKSSLWCAIGVGCWLVTGSVYAVDSAAGWATHAATIDVTQPHDLHVHVVSVQTQVGPTSVTVRGRIKRSRATNLFAEHDLVVAILDGTGREIARETRAIGPTQLPRRNSEEFPFVVSLSHALRSGEKIVVRLAPANT